MVVSGELKNVKVVEIPRDGGGTKRIYQLSFDEDTLKNREFRSVFVSALESALLDALENGHDVYASVVIRSVLPKTSKKGVSFVNYYGEVSDWKVFS